MQADRRVVHRFLCTVRVPVSSLSKFCTNAVFVCRWLLFLSLLWSGLALKGGGRLMFQRVCLASLPKWPVWKQLWLLAASINPATYSYGFCIGCRSSNVFECGLAAVTPASMGGIATFGRVFCIGPRTAFPWWCSQNITNSLAKLSSFCRNCVFQVASSSVLGFTNDVM